MVFQFSKHQNSWTRAMLENSCAEKRTILKRRISTARSGRNGTSGRNASRSIRARPTELATNESSCVNAPTTTIALSTVLAPMKKLKV